MRKVLVLWSLVGLSVVATHGQVSTFYVATVPGCLNSALGGSEAVPYCTVTYAKSIATPGDTFLIAAGRYNEGQITFTRSGTSASPITYRAVGDVIFGYDVDDAAFIPAPGLANVYSIAWTPSGNPGQVSQLRFAPILVDDPNPTRFTMVQEDGAIRLNQVTSDAVLVANEGTWRLNAGRLYIHAFGHRVPSTTDTDFVVGIGGAVGLTASANWQVFDGFRVLYSFNVTGSNITLRNLKYQGQQFTLAGSNNRTENITMTHVIVRDPANWTWHLSATGTAGTVTGGGHVLVNSQAYHNWNSSISTEQASLSAPAVFDGVILHGAPNHCSAGAMGATKISNFVAYNCQGDIQWTADNVAGMTIEHMVLPNGIGFEAITKPLGPITVRDSIMNGGFHFIRGLASRCTWEAGSVIEGNVFSSTATIEHCATMQTVPIAQYIANCDAGIWTSCAQFRNNRFVSDWSSVLVGGMWQANTDSWDVTLAQNSPALEIGPSTATRDLLGRPRPQGVSDAGVYEVGDNSTPVNCVVSDWGPWAATGPPTFANWAQTLTQSRTRTITTPPANGGTACPELTETRTVAQPCETITVTPALLITCNVAASGAQKK